MKLWNRIWGLLGSEAGVGAGSRSRETETFHLLICYYFEITLANNKTIFQKELKVVLFNQYRQTLSLAFCKHIYFVLKQVNYGYKSM